MSKFVNSYDALSSLVNCDMPHEDRKEAEKMIEEDLKIAEKAKYMKDSLEKYNHEIYLKIFGTPDQLVSYFESKMNMAIALAEVEKNFEKILKSVKVNIGETV